MVHTHYPLTPVIGARLQKTTSGNTTDGELAEFTLGSKVTAPDGQTWIYVQAGGAITQYDFVTIDEDFQAIAGTQAAVNDNHLIGFAQNAFSDNDFGWVALCGSNINCNVLSSCAADVQLYASGTAGKLDDSGTAGHLVQGVVCVASNDTATAGAVEVIATYPQTNRPGGDVS